MGGINWGLVATVTGVIGTLAGISIWLEQGHRETLQLALDNEIDRERLRNDLAETRGFSRYRVRIDNLNAELDAFFGPPTQRKAFDRSLAICLAYPVALFFLGWLFGGSGKIGYFSILPDDTDWPRRLLTAGCIVLAAIWSWLVFRSAIRIVRFTERKLRSIDFNLGPVIVNGIGIFIFAVAGLALSLGAVGLVFVGISVGAGGIPGASNQHTALAAAIFGYFPFGIAIIAGRRRADVSLIPLFVVSLGIAEAAALSTGAGSGPNFRMTAITFGLFFVVLPIANAVFDWLSWMMTRYYLRRAAIAPDGWYGIVLLSAELVGDIAVALLCLVGLAAAMPNFIELTNILLGWVGGPLIDWNQYLSAAIAAPFTRGFFVTSMLVTTLVPTFLHLFYGLGALFFAFWPDADAAARLIPEADQPWPSELDKARVIAKLTWRRIWYAPAGVVALALTGGLSWLVLVAMRPFGLTLAAVAQCSAAWHLGTCPLFLSQ